MKRRADPAWESSDQSGSINEVLGQDHALHIVSLADFQRSTKRRLVKPEEIVFARTRPSRKPFGEPMFSPSPKRVTVDRLLQPEQIKRQIKEGLQAGKLRLDPEPEGFDVSRLVVDVVPKGSRGEDQVLQVITTRLIKTPKPKAKRRRKSKAPKTRKESKESKSNVLSAEELGHILQEPFKNFNFNDFIATFAIYRECARLHKEQMDSAEATKPVVEMFEESLGYLNAETKEKFWQMAKKKFKALNGNTLSIIDMVQKGHFTNVFHYHDRHNVCLRKIGNYVSHRDFVVLVALCYFTGSRDFVDYIVAKVEDSAESKKYLADSIAEDPMGYARSQIQGFIQKNICYEKGTFASLYHRRFRPAMNWDNKWRSILARGLDNPNEVPEKLIELATTKLKEFFVGIANSSSEIASQKTYGDLFQTILAKSKPTKEVEFHAKNIANTLESKTRDWKDSAESKRNGLGPGFRAMCHVMQGLGKNASSLSTEEMEMALDVSTKSLQDVWPWDSRVRRRHMQALYCECQKVLGMARKGNVQGMISRSLARITTESLQKISMRNAKSMPPIY